MPPPRPPSGPASQPVSDEALILRHCKPSNVLDQDSSIRTVPDMFGAMFNRAVTTNDMWARQAVHPVPIHLVVATVCSGTDAPLTALSLIQEAALKLYGTEFLTYRHLFSCEIEPYKQAFIRRNHDPPIIFRNVVELGASGATQAMDSSGVYRDIPTDKIDMLIAGTSCVDFSNLNNRKDDKAKVNAFLECGFSKMDLAGDGDAVKLSGPTQQFLDAVHKQLSPEGLQSIGESMTTFLSTLNFIMERRPRIVIFENVQTAPWTAMQKFWLPHAGYVAKFVRLNSKDFHVPQDRLRGYLVALDARAFDGHKNENEDPSPLAAQLVHDACESVVSLKQRASASVLSFLMDDDDPAYLQARDEISRYGSHGQPRNGKRPGGNRTIDWDFCHLRHTIYCHRWNLDTERRFSQATLSPAGVVTIAPPAKSWIPYWARETPRVIDLFDNLYQQLLTRAGCDMNYKAALFNISQNLDRMPVEIANFGIAPIITPAGMPTLSNLGRPLLGVECLTLQGIPRDRLQLAGETHRELRDLAGNAMTTTVVGAVIMGVLMDVGKKLVDLQLRDAYEDADKGADGDAILPETSMRRCAELLERGLNEIPDWGVGEFTLDPSALSKQGLFKICHCSVVGAHKRIVYRCRRCEKVACQLCKANPPHEFERYDDAPRGLDIADLRVQLQQGMPGLFSMTMPVHKISRDPSFPVLEHRVHQRLRAAMSRVPQHGIYYFSGIKVSTSSTIVEYRSLYSVARLTFSRLGDVAWYILANRTGDIASSSVGERDRRQLPYAQGIIRQGQSTVDPDAAEWSIWSQTASGWQVLMKVEEDGSFSFDLATMKAVSSAPPAHLEGRVQETIAGEWQASPGCGTAGEGLYIRKTGKPLFCFKNVDPVGHPVYDWYIISSDIELAETYDYRGNEVKLEVLQIPHNTKTVRVSVPGYWEPLEPARESALDPDVRVTTRIHSPRQGVDYFEIASCATMSGTGAEPDSCHVIPALTFWKSSIYTANIPLFAFEKQRWTARWHQVSAIEMEGFLRSIRFMANALGKGHLLKPDFDHSFDPVRGQPVKLCRHCCIEPPQLHWVKGSHTVVPWEEPASVLEHAGKLKAMPEPFVARVTLDMDPSYLPDSYEAPNDSFLPPRASEAARSHGVLEDGYTWRVQLAVNPRTIASRAAAHLAYGSRPRQFSPTILAGVQCSFQIEVGLLAGPNARFDNFYDLIPTTKDTTGLERLDRLHSAESAPVLRNGHSLREEQVRSVEWMLAREKAPASYLETETEEHVLDALNLRIVGRAAYLNDGSTFFCRGGILAHEIGYGKTVVTIALLELRRSFDVAGSVVRRREAAVQFWESELSFFHLEATLILVPGHITTQWAGEFAKFAGLGPRDVMVIKRYPDLQRKRLSELQGARVIIVSTSIFSAAYTDGLNLLHETRPLGGKSDRELEARYRASLATIRQVVRRYREQPWNLSDEKKEEAAIKRVHEVISGLNQTYQEMCEQWTSGGGRKEANKRQRQGSTKPAAAPKRLVKVKPVWSVTRFLENFSFARIVVDEFSYDNPAVTLFLSNALSNARWLLSGTPRCNNLADIIHQGRLLSIHVARPDPRIPTYLDPITAGPQNWPKAPTEEYRERANPLRSHNFALDRHRAAEAFVKHFVRQDKVDMDKFERVDRKVVVELPLLAKMAYAGFRHDLAMANGDIFRLPHGRRTVLHVLGILDLLACHKAPGDIGATGPTAGDLMMARFAALPMTADIMLGVVGSAEFELRTLLNEVKLAMDKLVWLYRRLQMVDQDVRVKFPRYYQMRTLADDVFTAMADARDSWDKWPMAAFGGRDAFYKLAKAICPTSRFRHQEGGVEDWLSWRYVEAKSFWPDWYDMPVSYIDSLADPSKRRELVELATDAVLLSISYPMGRTFHRTGGVEWLESHVIVLGRALDERMRHSFLSYRRAGAIDQLRAASARDTVPKFSTAQLVHFLKRCVEERGPSFGPVEGEYEKLVARGKQQLQKECLELNLRFSQSNSAGDLARKFMAYSQGRCTAKDFIDKRGVMTPRAAFPVPNQICDRRGGKTEATLEEMTLTYNYLMSCRDAWFQAIRRYRLAYLTRYVLYCRRHRHVEKYCDACCRRPVCKGEIPGYLVLACGHWLCEEHNVKVNQDGARAYCPAIGCGAPCATLQPVTIKLTEQEFLACPHIWTPAGEEQCSKGGKVPRILDLIAETPEDDKVVLFTYIKELAAEVREQLEENGVSVISMVNDDPDADLATELQKFKDGEAKVIIIDPTAEHAAGSNLTIANHVIFASPLIERDPNLLKTQYRQSVGRCLRQGQTKKVTVYTIVTKGTIDEEFYTCEDADGLTAEGGAEE